MTFKDLLYIGLTYLCVVGALCFALWTGILTVTEARGFFGAVTAVSGFYTFIQFI